MSTHNEHGPVVRHEQVHIAENSPLRRIPMIAGAIGIAALAAGFGLKGAESQRFFFTYLTALMYFLALGLGGLFFVLIQHAARAGWSITSRRIAENMALTLPALGLLLMPVVFLGAHDLFHWTHLEVVENDPVLTAKKAFLNEGFFQTRAMVYVALWSLMGAGYWFWSTTQDKQADPKPLQHRMRWCAPLGILVFALSVTFAAVDYLMSLDPHWFSTIFGVYYFAGCVVSTHAFIALVAIVLHRSGYLRGVITIEHFHDLGKMMFAFTVFWGYIGFSQYMLIWYASIPEETEWYAYRVEGQYWHLSLALVFARFVIPFLGLMSRRFKRNPKWLAFWACWILGAQFLDMVWLIHPVMDHNLQTLHPKLALGIFDLLTFVGIGGVFIAVFSYGLISKALVPLKDPRLAESVNFENF